MPQNLSALLIALVMFAGITACATAGDRAEQPDPAPKPEIVSAEAWGSDPHPFPKDYAQTPQTVLIHHAGVVWKADDQPEAKLRTLQDWGWREKGWSDVPYHFLIAPDGRIFQGRPLNMRPDTNTDFDTAGYVNVELFGNFNEQRVSPAQLASLVAVSAWLADRIKMPTEDLVAHRDLAQTVCPGDDLYRYLEKGLIQKWIDTTRAGDRPEVHLLPSAKNGPTEMTPSSPRPDEKD